MNEEEILNLNPPRDIEKIRPLIKSNSLMVTGLILTAPILFLILNFRIYYKAGISGVFSYGIILGLILASIPLYFAWAMKFISEKSLIFLQNAIAVEGKILTLKYDKNVGLTFEVEYMDNASRKWKGKGVAAFSENTSMKIGDLIKVFFDPKTTKKFVIYFPKVGLVFGNSKEIG